jgi:hypothetical protein
MQRPQSFEVRVSVSEKNGLAVACDPRLNFLLSPFLRGANIRWWCPELLFLRKYSKVFLMLDGS